MALRLCVPTPRAESPPAPNGRQAIQMGAPPGEMTQGRAFLAPALARHDGHALRRPPPAYRRPLRDPN